MFDQTWFCHSPKPSDAPETCVEEKRWVKRNEKRKRRKRRGAFLGKENGLYSHMLSLISHTLPMEGNIPFARQEKNKEGEKEEEKKKKIREGSSFL